MFFCRHRAFAFMQLNTFNYLKPQTPHLTLFIITIIPSFPGIWTLNWFILSFHPDLSFSTSVVLKEDIGRLALGGWRTDWNTLQKWPANGRITNHLFSLCSYNKQQNSFVSHGLTITKIKIIKWYNTPVVLGIFC